MSPAPRLRARTLAVDVTGDLLTRIPDEVDPREVVAWLREGDGLVGWGCAAEVRTHGEDRFAAAERWWDELRGTAQVEDEVRLPGTGLVAFGSFAFSPGSADPSVLTVPRVLIGRRDGLAWVTQVVVEGEPWPPGHPVELLGRSNPHISTPDPLVESEGAVPASGWPAVISRGIDRIVAGEVDKVVLARDVVVRHDLGHVVRLAPVLERLECRYAATWTFAVAGLVGATPEMLVRLQGGRARSRVLAGTMRRANGIPLPAEPTTGPSDPRLHLVSSAKDLDEHAYAVRSVSEALAPHCTDLHVPEAPYVLELPDVYHLASDLTGTMVSGATSLRLAAALHPTAAVCGTPTDVAARVIGELEGMDRGRYAGPVGWMDGSGDGDWGIALRCGELAPDRRSMRLFAGGGIVAASDPEAELAETEVKLTAMRHALGLATR
ncbi:isochorismate synthase [Ornithinimicrobium tianjinense]|uniref:Isochorismate synthase n=1 Tax=Ornithinimicrobium tianjinense TaxID=1195761 RepID=A0A917F6I2_9MICO|nr:chorismate-binding protein [Ornithinimicrobium tianjinense]GGF55765.1 isochorismate synthase [Ornithinimicrobium tianjinense]